MNSRILVLLLLASMTAGCTDSTPSNIAAESHSNPAMGSASLDEASTQTIRAGMPMKSVLGILDSAGCTTEGVWQWGTFDSDEGFTWRKISNEIQIALSYHEKTQQLIDVSMMYIPPEYTHRGNYLVVAVDEITFNNNGTYTVTFSKPAPLSDE